MDKKTIKKDVGYMCSDCVDTDNYDLPCGGDGTAVRVKFYYAKDDDPDVCDFCKRSGVDTMLKYVLTHYTFG